MIEFFAYLVVFIFNIVFYLYTLYIPEDMSLKFVCMSIFFALLVGFNSLGQDIFMYLALGGALLCGIDSIGETPE